MATENELNELKRNWKSDPCWDIWDTEGFEENEEELRLFQGLIEKEWLEKENNRIKERCLELNCSIPLLLVIENLESRILKLEMDKP